MIIFEKIALLKHLLSIPSKIAMFKWKFPEIAIKIAKNKGNTSLATPVPLAVITWWRDFLLPARRVLWWLQRDDLNIPQNTPYKNTHSQDDI